MKIVFEKSYVYLDFLNTNYSVCIKIDERAVKFNNKI